MFATVGWFGPRCWVVVLAAAVLMPSASGFPFSAGALFFVEPIDKLMPRDAVPPPPTAAVIPATAFLPELKHEEERAVMPNEPPKFGRLKLCPPGGPSFYDALSMACPMRRKRSTLFGPTPSLYRPATSREIMEICCKRGCELTDLFPYCGPFGSW